MWQKFYKSLPTLFNKNVYLINYISVFFGLLKKYPYRPISSLLQLSHDKVAMLEFFLYRKFNFDKNKLWIQFFSELEDGRQVFVCNSGAPKQLLIFNSANALIYSACYQGDYLDCAITAKQNITIATYHRLYIYDHHRFHVLDLGQRPMGSLLPLTDKKFLVCECSDCRNASLFTIELNSAGTSYIKTQLKQFQHDAATCFYRLSDHLIAYGTHRGRIGFLNLATNITDEMPCFSSRVTLITRLDEHHIVCGSNNGCVASIDLQNNIKKIIRISDQRIEHIAPANNGQVFISYPESHFADTFILKHIPISELIPAPLQVISTSMRL